MINTRRRRANTRPVGALERDFLPLSVGRAFSRSFWKKLDDYLPSCFIYTLGKNYGLE